MRPRLATLWLDGCSGCHMSLLDLDQRLLEVTADFEVFPEAVDVTLVEGAVSTARDLDRIRTVRARTRVLVSLGDCAVTGNVPGLRNLLEPGVVLSVYDDAPREEVPELLAVRPVHQVVPVEHALPGCPPAADAIYEILCAVREGRPPVLPGVRFGG
jgi:NAD-reducing hydrogenase small subunit